MRTHIILGNLHRSHKTSVNPVFPVKRSFDITSTVTAAAVLKKIGSYQDGAVRDPVIITKNGRPRTVLIAYEDYLRLPKRDRRIELKSAPGDDDLPPSKLRKWTNRSIISMPKR
jgi:hypothetical protein